ncbi:hypothetical protein [Shewanella ulleungensis]|jgi:hypothetical protein|uniref:Uncharacterized protein n=1 Tax=Shewanella ulleungensis TaxID=2282699 RepID=A0ABQ2QCT0_9GAMM|nr:hypothetical protein [Shewanella ulleungensis]MCL1148745.1 hypothetical protein [Shewanella ulleungensis]GGP75887.1 hypothetical protein GCM10009410_05180 [Shewanella ulleungensis]
MQHLHEQTLQQMYLASLSVIAAHNEDKSNQLLTQLKGDTQSLLACTCRPLEVSEQHMLEFCRDVLLCLSKASKPSNVQHRIKHLDIAASSNDDNPAPLVNEELEFIQQQFIE